MKRHPFFQLFFAALFYILATPVFASTNPNGTETPPPGPTAVCDNPPVMNLNASGQASIQVTDIFHFTGEGLTYSATVLNFDCSHVGIPQTRTVTVTDVNGLMASCTKTFTVADPVAPTIVCQNYTHNLVTPVGVPISYSSLVGTLSDNCGVLPVSGTFTASCATLGANTVTVTATDTHGNTSSCTATVTVVQVIPNVVCVPTIVYLDANQTATLTPGQVSLPLGSLGCGGEATLSVSPSALTCTHLGNTVVTVTATDNNGGTSTCSTTVVVLPSSPPTITCYDITVSLDALGHAFTAGVVSIDGDCNYGNYNVFPSPLVVDCGDIGNPVTVTASLGNTCTATVTVVDDVPPVVFCKNLIANLPPSGAVTVTPADILLGAVDNCGTANPVSVSPGTVGCGVSTVTLTVSDGHGNTGTCTATVTVADHVPPTVTCKNYTANLGAVGSASIPYLAIYDTGLDNCGGFVLPTSLTPNTFNCTQLGAHLVTLTVSDEAGNTATCTSTVLVVDNVAPTVTCPANQTLAPTGSSPCSAVVNGIDASFGDNCSSVSLAYLTSGATTNAGAWYASGQTFLAGTTTVTYYATDGSGHQTTCSFTVTVNGCSPVFSGSIKWEHDGTSGVQAATVNLTGAGTGSAVTGSNGAYQISIPPATGNFTLKPVKNTNKLNGLTSADATAIQQHVANTVLLPAPFKRIAADVNKSNSITALDATLITQALQGNQAALNQITSWRFVPTAYNFPNPNVPWGFPEQIDLTGVSGSVSGQDFKGIKLGDVVSTWANPAGLGKGTELKFQVQDQVLQAGAEVNAEFRADQLDDLASFQFALYFDPEQLQLVEIEPLNGLPLSADHFGTYNQADGEIRVVWAQAAGVLLSEAAPVFRLRFRALESGARLSEALRLDEEVLAAHAYNSAFAESGVQLRYWEATGTEQGTTTPDFWLENQPNPFVEFTTIRFELPRADEVELRISDASGRLLFSQTKNCPAGRYDETLRLEGAIGALTAELITKQGRVVRKMLAIR